jgi:hypothetical protein
MSGKARSFSVSQRNLSIGEGILIKLPALFIGKIGDVSVKPEWFRFNCLIVQTRCRISGDELNGGMTDERSKTSLGDACE